MLKSLQLFFSTVKFLKPIQIKYQILYRIIKPKKLSAYQSAYNNENVISLQFKMQPPVYRSYLGANRFRFLNIEHDFGNQVNWNSQQYSKLWNYNLQYGNYLLQSEIPTSERLDLIHSLYRSLISEELPLEPYPVSLRAINVIRFLSHQAIKDDFVLSHLHAELGFLSKRPEYHLLGNHLLENAFALMMGGAFFTEKNWIEQGEEILLSELNEQILNDGAHFELSPMYHQIILFRVLEFIDWYKNYSEKKASMLMFMEEKASSMISWLKNIAFQNGQIPHFNDSTEGIGYSTNWLCEYANALNISIDKIELSDSGYRSVNMGDYECRIDFAPIGASYQPGHAHADALSFLLNYKGQPFFVEAGTSTYEIGERRNIERSTISHNTVTVADKNQSQVWGGFRVGNRAKTTILKDAISNLSAKHDGYKKIGITHFREFDFQQKSFVIKDEIVGNSKLERAFHLHMAPGLQVTIEGTSVAIGTDVIIEFEGASRIEIADFELANGFNNYLKSKKIIVSFAENLNSRFII